jgi:hypothetical protein
MNKYINKLESLRYLLCKAEEALYAAIQIADELREEMWDYEYDRLNKELETNEMLREIYENNPDFYEKEAM